MGPSGSGKSTVGAALATLLGAVFIDGDDLHPAANVAKMAAGIPLDDDDRMPWLRAVGEALSAHEDVVVACSALKRSYRDLIRSVAPDAYVAELAVARSELEKRMRSRGEHFMPASLLDSQLETLEPLDADERGVRIGETAGVEEAAAAIADAAGRAQSLR
ncbi:MAG: gluconokinase [Microbacterium sp.]|nr:gluconokinase [Microbacterium sp.]